VEAVKTNTGINDVGQVVGSSWLSGNLTDHAFIWSSSGGMRDLGTLGGPDTIAFAVNSLGQVVGRSSTSTKEVVAFVYARNSGMQSIGAGDGSWLTSVNSNQEAVGIMGLYSKLSAFLWRPSKQIQTLSKFFAGVSEAYGINGLGQIAVTADLVGDLTTHAFLLTPSTD
jgi:probable HAF family extracellular repeat protein